MASSCRVAVLARLPKISPAAIATNTRKMTIFQGPSLSIASQGRGRGRHSTVARGRLLSMDATVAAASHSNPNPNTNESSTALVKLHIHNADDKDVQVASLILDSPPTNALTLEMLLDISSNIHSVENDHPDIQGLILRSNNPRIFSSGLNLHELHNPQDPERLAACWHAFQQVFIDLYGSRLATVAAIEGHAPAAGCLLALSCDYRIMASSDHNAAGAGTIGLNETVFGLVPPFWMFDLYARTIGVRNAEQAMTLGGLYSPEDALKYGLVDHLAERGHVEEEALREMRRWLVVDSETRVKCRQVTRMPFIEELERQREQDVQQFCDNIMCDTVQAKISAYVQRLKARMHSKTV
jgi:3,2-trans-enoyl-CoA isomerase